MTPFARALSVASIDGSSMSRPITGSKPSSAAAIVSTPEPHPTSSSGPGSSSWSVWRQSWVVWCEPVPKARPGSTTTVSASPGGVSHGGPTQSLPTRIGRWNWRQRSSQPLSTSALRPLPKNAQKRSSPAASGVRGELGAAVCLVDLLEAFREELDHRRARLLETLAADLDRDAAQALRDGCAQRNALFSLSKKLSSPAR